MRMWSRRRDFHFRRRFVGTFELKNFPITPQPWTTLQITPEQRKLSSRKPTSLSRFFVGNFDYFDGDFFPCDEAWAQLPATRDFHESVNHDLIDRGLVTSNVNVTHNFFWDVPVVKIPTDQGILYEVDVFSEPDSNVMYPWISFDASNPSTCWTQDEQIAVLDDIPPWTDNLTITNGGCNLHPNGEIAQGYNLDFHIAILLTNDGVMKYHDEDGSHLHSFDPYWIENRSAWTFLPHHRLHPFHDWYSAPQINGSYGGLGNPPLQVLNASIEPSYVGQFAPS